MTDELEKLLNNKGFRPSNEKTKTQFSLEQLKKLAVSRNIPLEKLVAQIVAEYLKEDQAES